MEMVTKMMGEEEDSKVIHTYNIGNKFRDYTMEKCLPGDNVYILN